MQVFGRRDSEAHHQTQSPVPWQPPHPALGTPSAGGQSSYNPHYGTPNATQSTYPSQSQYPATHPQSRIEGGASTRMPFPHPDTSEGAPFHSQQGYSRGQEQVHSQTEFLGSGRDSTNTRPQPHRMPPECAPRQPELFGEPQLDHARCEGPRDVHAFRGARGHRRDCSPDNFPDPARSNQSSLGRRGIHSTPSARTSSGGGTSRGPQSSLKDTTPLAHLNNSPELLRNNSSKSSSPYSLSQRKQLRVEEKSFLKEVKRSIAEGRVPQVRLQQNNSGDVIQYKAQFLNAVKLAALSLVPNAFIDVKNASTMQEIMKEVQRQFIIEKPLPDGMVAGFLQRLYKRNRSMYHRHWTVHGDQSKPDECTPAAWLQLVDYWKSTEGSKECERNKANASAKKGGAIRYSTLNTT